MNQADHEGDDHVSLDEGADALLVRRDAQGVSLARIGTGEHAWLEALAAGASFGAAIDAEKAADATFDLSTALHARIADATIAGIAAP